MTNLSLQLAMREWREHMGNPMRLWVLVGTGAILAIVAPFGTDASMTMLPRFVYWLALVGMTYSIGCATYLISNQLAPDRIVMRTALAAVMTGAGAMSVVYLLNGMALQYWATGSELTAQVVNVFLIAAILAGIFQTAYGGWGETAPPSPPKLLDRLPFDKRGPLVSLTVEDHYVNIRTTKGQEMVLIRLADAIGEVGDTPGARVHRSHWAAFNQVRSAARKGDGAVLQMAHGPDIPVSRANVAKLKEAGLLPG